LDEFIGFELLTTKDMRCGVSFYFEFLNPIIIPITALTAINLKLSSSMYLLT
jgi:hypothetical protein